MSTFSGLSSLRVLSLSGNRLDENWVRRGLFRGLRSLVALDLSANHLARLDEGIFEDLEQLQALNLVGTGETFVSLLKIGFSN